MMDKGAAATYRLVHGILRKRPDPFEIRLIGLNDSLTGAAFCNQVKGPVQPVCGSEPEAISGNDMVRWVHAWRS
jgi:hypothetical protein